MNNIRHAIALGAFLIVVGVGIFLIKTIALDYPVTPDATKNTYNFEIYLEFDGRDRPARLEVLLPAGDVERTFPQERFYNGPFGLTLSTDAATRNRRAVWTYRYPSDRKVLRYTAQTTGETPATALPEEFRTRAPEPSETFGDTPLEDQAFVVWSGDLRRRSADVRSYVNLALDEIFRNRDDDEPYADEMQVLLEGADRLGKLRLAVETLRRAGVPARIANGVFLTTGKRRADLERWLEYAIEGEGARFFPGAAPSRFFTLYYGDGALVTDSGVDDLDVQITIQEEINAAIDLVLRNDQARFSSLPKIFGFHDLPLTTQLVYAVLVTIPIGITILVFLRQFIGVQTLGTFMPVLIGIAFRETALLNGLLLFSTLILLGLALRFYLERLQLLLVPRLAVVVIFIVILMAGITNGLANASQSVGLSISLFPIVILTMTIERMSIVWEESSPTDAIKQGVGSLGVAAITYLAMANDRVEYLMYQFPELLLALMGICILMGRYTGLRLSEFWRFRTLAQ